MIPNTISIIGIAINNPKDLTVSIKEPVVPIWNTIIPMPTTVISTPTYVPKTSSSNEAQANITNENGEVIITSAESGFSVVPEGAALFSATQDDMNELVVNDKGAFMNKNRIVDYSMTLTTGEIDIICADN